MKRNRIRLTEGDLRKIVKESVRRVLRENEEKFHVYPHLLRYGTKGPIIVEAAFIEYTYCFDREKLGTFDTIDEAVRFIEEKSRDREFIKDLTWECYEKMEEGDETSLDKIILNGYIMENGTPYYIGNGIGVKPII